jgi:MFS family permease
MGRKILAVVVAMITAVAIIWISYMIGTMIAPNTPKNVQYETRKEIADYMQTFPISAFVAVFIGYALAAFAGGFISTKMGRRWSGGMSLALIVGLLLSIGSVLISLTWPQPLWFVLGSLVIFVPISLLGYRFAR